MAGYYLTCQYCHQTAVKADFVAPHQDRCYRCGATSTPPPKGFVDPINCGRWKCDRRGQCPANCARWKSPHKPGRYINPDLFGNADEA